MQRRHIGIGRRGDKCVGVTLVIGNCVGQRRCHVGSLPGCRSCDSRIEDAPGRAREMTWVRSPPCGRQPSRELARPSRHCHRPSHKPLQASNLRKRTSREREIPSRNAPHPSQSAVGSSRNELLLSHFKVQKSRFRAEDSASGGGELRTNSCKICGLVDFEPDHSLFFVSGNPTRLLKILSFQLIADNRHLDPSSHGTDFPVIAAKSGITGQMLRPVRHGLSPPPPGRRRRYPVNAGRRWVCLGWWHQACRPQISNIPTASTLPSPPRWS